MAGMTQSWRMRLRLFCIPIKHEYALAAGYLARPYISIWSSYAPPPRDHPPIVFAKPGATTSLFEIPRRSRYFMPLGVLQDRADQNTIPEQNFRTARLSRHHRFWLHLTDKSCIRNQTGQRSSQQIPYLQCSLPKVLMKAHIARSLIRRGH